VSSIPVTRDLVLAPADNVRLVELCGPLDQHLHQIEARLGVEVKRRGNRFQIIGMPAAIKLAEAVLQDLYTRAQREPVDSERVHIALQELGMDGRAEQARGEQGGDPNTTPAASNDELKVRTARAGPTKPNTLTTCALTISPLGSGRPARVRRIWPSHAPSRRCSPKASAGSFW